MHKIALAFAAASFSGLGGIDATAAPAFWQGAWGHPPTALSDLPPMTRPDGGTSRPVCAPCRHTRTRPSAKWCASLVTFGDSITEGVVSTPGAFRSWPDRFGRAALRQCRNTRLDGRQCRHRSNRLLHDTPSTNALSRFDRDVLSVPGVKTVIVLLGINDIQYSHRNAAETVHAPEDIAGFRQLIDRAHAAGLKIYGATITPFEGSPDYIAEGESDRQAVNSFVRSGAFDGVVDFDAALRDPARPTHLRADTESAGHLHPNDAGYRVLGDSIDLKLFN